MTVDESNIQINWDFSNIGDFLDLGFSDEQLELLCEYDYLDKDKLYGLKPSPWLFWTTELYSFGKCYRHWLGWPNWLPIPVYGDHGADPEGELFDHEINNKAKYHFCFYSGRYQAIISQRTNKIPLRVPHAWVTYRKSMGIEKDVSAEGCLVFVPHSVHGIEVINVLSNVKELIGDVEKYFDLKCIKLCIHMHDVRKGLHRDLRKLGLPLFTLGNSSSQLFVDRFYKLSRTFQAAASSSSASQLYYCVELGLDYYLLGSKPEYYNHGHSGIALGNVVNSDVRNIALKKDEIFFRLRRGNREQINKWIDEVLGLDEVNINTPAEIRKIFIRETVRLALPIIPICFRFPLLSLLPTPLKAQIKRFFRFLSR